MSEVLSIPQDCFKFLIGTKGSVKKDIETRSGAVLIVDDKVTVKGTPDKIAKAKDIIFNQVLKGKVFSSSKTVVVPAHLHKFIVGSKGATIKEIESAANCKVEIPKSGDNVVIHANNSKDADSAESRIKKIISENANKVDETTAFKEEFPVINYVHKYVLGPNGETADQVKQKTATSIQLKGDKMTIYSHQKENIRKAYDLLYTRLNELGWFYDSKKGWYENNPQDAVYKAARAEAEKYAAERAACFEKSRKAYDAKDGAGAKAFSEKAKEAENKMKLANDKAAKLIFEWKNKAFDDYTIDMHGLLVEEAMTFLKERVAKLKGMKNRKRNTLDIITGAGNHSDGQNAKIKPTIKKYLEEQKIKFSETNSGTYTANL